MVDLISREAAIDAACKGADNWDGRINLDRNIYIRDAINDIPSVPAVPVEAISIDLASKWLATIYDPPTRKAAGLTEAEKTKAWKSFLTEIASS